MASEFNRKLDDLEELLINSVTLPLVKDKYIVDGKKFDSIVKALRESLPVELSKANDVIAQSDKLLSRAEEEATTITDRSKKNAELILSKAKTNAEAIVEQAKVEAEELVSQQQITSIANERAAQVVEQAKTDAIKMRNVTLDYLEKIIAESERSLDNAMTALNQVKKSFGGDKDEKTEK